LISAFLGFVSLVAVPALAQSIYVYPTAVTAPKDSYQTVTAVVTGVNNKTVTWTTDGGTIVGTNPCVVNEPCTVALYATTAGTYHLTATSNANGSVSATSTMTITASPTPVATHPRLYVTAAMLSGLQAKAVTGSPMYSAMHGPTGQGNSAAEFYTQLSTGGTYTNNYATYNWSWTCEGGTGLPTSGGATPYGLAGAADAFAFMALIDPNTSTGTNWGCYGHDVWMYIVNQFNSGAYTPGQDEVRNQAAGLGLATDWLLGSGAITTSGDISACRTYVAKMLKYIMVNYLNGWYPGANTAPGWYNSSNMFPAITDVRNLGNNYSETRFFLIPALALTFNNTTLDDPPLTNTCGATAGQVCSDWTAYNMHAYFTYFVGSILYSTNLHMEDPNVTWQAYQAAYSNLPTIPTCLDWEGSNGIGSGYIPCFGDGRGGESSEGNGYGYSIGGIRAGLNVIWTAGYADPLVYGPQMSLETSSWWDLHNVTISEFLTGMQAKNGGLSGTSPAFGVINTGDENFYQTYPNNLTANSATMVFDTYTGRTDRMSSLEWPVLNTAYGGPAGTLLGCSNYCGFNYDMTVIIANAAAQDFFIALPAADPVASPPADPRPSMPYDLWNGSYNQHQMVRTGFTTSDTLISITCGNTLIDHEHNFCGRIEVYSGNEFITKGRTTFDDYNPQMSTAPQSNELAVVGGQTNCGTPATDSTFWWACAQGGQWWHGQQAGFALPLHSELSTYAANITDMTNQYNQWPFPTNVSGASRSTIILKGTKQVVFYDRGATGVAQEKAVYVNTTGTPTIAGNVASWPTQSGTQKAYLTTLLPSGAVPVNIGLTSGPAQAPDWELVTTLQVDGGSTTSNQFLHVLEWGASSFTKSTTTLVQSTAGQGFGGSLVGTSLVMFMRSWPGSFTGTTFPASGATTIYVSDLTPNMTYVVTGTGTPANCTTDTAGVCTFGATGTGNITLGISTTYLTGITVSPASASVIALGNQQFTATCGYSDGSSVNCTFSVTWESSSLNVVTINSSGSATGVGQGGANIIATSAGVQGQAAVTVPAATLQSITITPGSTTVPVGNTQQFKATGTYSDSSTSDLTAAATWSSSNVAMATVNSGGMATGMATGSANILAISGNLRAQAAVTVLPAATINFSPVGGSYTSAQSVIISTTTPSATVYYTTNGSTPTTSSAAYSGPITVSSTETVQAIAVVGGYSTSAAVSATYTINLPAATLTFSPAGGTYTSAQSVTIGTTPPSATIYYTTNGSTPTTSSAVYAGSIAVSSTETVQAIAVGKGFFPSAVASASYTINPPAATPTFSPAGGTYASAQPVTIGTTTPSATIYYTTNGSTPTTSSVVYARAITVSSTETINAIAVASGSSSAAGSATYTINLPAATPTFSPAGGNYTSAQTVTIGTTTPSATIYYTTNGSTPTTSSAVYAGSLTVSSTETVQAIAVASGYSTSAAGSATYTINLSAATVTFSPAGGTYTSAQSVTIGTTTPSATIYYTTNGSTPTTSSGAYSGPITVSSTETVKAIAVASGYSTNAAVSATYTINLPAAVTPIFSPAGGTYTSAQSVTIGTTTPSATIYYTTNGSTPTTSSAVYTGPVTISSTETINAIAVTSGYSTSAVASASYAISLPAAVTPTFSPAGGTYTSAQTVNLSASHWSTIYYTTNGSTPTTSSAVYTGSITVSSTETVQAIAVTSGYSTSAVASASFTIGQLAASPSFSVDVSPASLTVAAGASGTTTVLVTPQNGFAAETSLTCAGLPSWASCTFSPSTVTPSGSIASSTLTITTTPMQEASRSGSSALFPGSALAISLCCVGWRRRRGLQMLVLAVAILGAGLCMGCGANITSPVQATVTVIAAHGDLAPTTSLTLTLM
jgi:hypothetical protein